MKKREYIAELLIGGSMNRLYRYGSYPTIETLERYLNEAERPGYVVFSMHPTTDDFIIIWKKEIAKTNEKTYLGCTKDDGKEHFVLCPNCYTSNPLVIDKKSKVLSCPDCGELGKWETVKEMYRPKEK